MKSKSKDEIDRILDDLEIPQKFRMNELVYPQLKFNITRQEVKELKHNGIIGVDNLLTDIKTPDPLAKLLYAIAWKNGDLKKVKHIIEGILSDQEGYRKSGLVFYQFGKHLAKKSSEPIIDQHVLRAFGIFKARGDKAKVAQLKKLSVITKAEKELIHQYKEWLRTALTEELRENDGYRYHVDKVLFAVGKSIKVRVKK